MNKIEWTDRVWNPVRGCSRVSEGCRNCYAERIAARFSDEGKPFHGFAVSSPEGHGARWTGNVALIPEKLDEPFHWRKPSRVFVNSMSDLFHEKLSDEEIGKVFGIMADSRCKKHTFQILTKRPKRMLEWSKMADLPADYWLGVSVEDQATADERIPLLLQTPAAVRLVSYEPALGPVDFEAFFSVYDKHGEPSDGRYNPDGSPAIGRLIYGGESGPGARPNDIAWARSARDQCKAAGVAFFCKQFGARPIIDGIEEPERLSRTIFDRKGGDMDEWPKDLRAREFPR